MTQNEVKAKVEAHNMKIDTFINEELPKLLEERGVKVTDGTIPMASWFTAMALIRKQDFYTQGMAILKPARAEGFNVLMDMQSDKLVF